VIVDCYGNRRYYHTYTTIQDNGKEQTEERTTRTSLDRRVMDQGQQDQRDKSSTSQHSISTNQQSTSTSHHNVTQAAACGNPTTTSTTTEARTGTTSCSTLQAHNQDAYTTATIHSSSAPFDYVTQ